MSLITRVGGRRALVETPGWYSVMMPAHLCPALYGDREKHGHIDECYAVVPDAKGPWIDKDEQRWSLYNVTAPHWPEIRWAVTPQWGPESEMEFAEKHLDLFPVNLLE